jgi:hypothetical protein
MTRPGLKLPVISLLLMAIFLVGGSIALVLDWPPGPAHLDWGVWIVVYFGYVYVNAASVYYVLTGR